MRNPYRQEVSGHRQQSKSRASPKRLIDRCNAEGRFQLFRIGDAVASQKVSQSMDIEDGLFVYHGVYWGGQVS